MAQAPQSRGGYLTLVELVFSYAAYIGIGYWVGGATGAAIGGTLITVLVARAILIAAYRD